ncbi:MAG: alpha/beta fold hydrolase [Desulfobacteraceae bacterium]|nr:alpha/beta fold hydrolase [Desulfobacteraceae bacterium]
MQEILFFNADGLRLHGILHLPETEKPPLIIGVHGLLSNGDSPKQKALAEGCTRMGLAYFRFDHRGCGKSQGEFAGVTGFQGRLNDLAAAVDTLSKRDGIGDVKGLFGSSFGGAVVLSMAADLDIMTIVTLAAPVRLSSINAPGSYETEPRLSGIKKGQLDFDISDRLHLVHSVLVCHGDADTVVPYENALKIYEAAREPKKLLRLPNGDHQVSDSVHQKTFMENSLQWLGRAK